MLISKINEIADNRERATDLQKKVQNRRENGDGKTFQEILQEELDKEKGGSNTDV